MGFSRQEYWSGLPFPSPGDLSNPEIEPWSLALQADSLLAEPQGKNPNEYYEKLSPHKFDILNEVNKLSKTSTRNRTLIHTKAMATHSSTLAWKIPWTEEPDRLQFMGSQRVGYD